MGVDDLQRMVGENGLIPLASPHLQEGRLPGDEPEDRRGPGSLKAFEAQSKDVFRHVPVPGPQSPPSRPRLLVDCIAARCPAPAVRRGFKSVGGAGHHGHIGGISFRRIGEQRWPRKSGWHQAAVPAGAADAFAPSAGAGQRGVNIMGFARNSTPAPRETKGTPRRPYGLSGQVVHLVTKTPGELLHQAGAEHRRAPRPDATARQDHAHPAARHRHQEMKGLNANDVDAAAASSGLRRSMGLQIVEA